MIWVIAITATVLFLVGIAVLRGKCDEIIAGRRTAAVRYEAASARRCVLLFCDGRPALPVAV